MSDATIDAGLVAIGTLLTGLAGGSVFVGVFRDDTRMQTKLMQKKGLDAPTAARDVASRRRTFAGVFIGLWCASLLVDAVAIIATLSR